MAEKSPEELRKEAEQVEQGEKSAGSKDPSRVAGGKKAAATRKERYGTARPGLVGDRSDED